MTEFNPELNTFFLWDTCRLYKTLINTFTSIMSVLYTWFCLKNKEIVLSKETKKL
jgi:hypothetical protein